jgi:MFS family permease
VAQGTPRLLGRDFLLLWQGQLVSQLGNQALLVASLSWTLEATGSPALMGLLLMASTLPAVALGPIAGAMADRIPDEPSSWRPIWCGAWGTSSSPSCWLSPRTPPA